MKKYSIRFNHSRGQIGRGTIDHVWRIFENDKEYLFKNFVLNVFSVSERDEVSNNWNVTCYGFMTIDRNTSTAIINPINSTIE